jgi:small subunit ribosomal protein S16
VVKIRLMRMGSKKNPVYRIVAADSRAPRDGKFLDILGYYDPQTKPHTLSVQTERVKSWIERGAQPTERVERLLSKLMKPELGTGNGTA